MGEFVETSSKRQRVCEEEIVDRISSLPDSVLVHILSCLPTKDAVRTVLVPRFRHLCNFLTTLTFDSSWYGGDEYGCKEFFDYVRLVLIYHQNGTIEKFALKVDVNFLFSKKVDNANDEDNHNDDDDDDDEVNHNDDDDDDEDNHVEYEDLYLAGLEKRKASEVDSWIHLAMRKNVKVLHLDFLLYGEPKPNASYRLPSVVFRGKYLTELKLVACEIKPVGKIQLNCLKRLFLKDVVLNDETINRILSGCLVLEELSLIHCYGLSRLGFGNPSIKSLILNHALEDDRVEISCPNIESLDIAGYTDLVDLVDVSSVVDSSISLGYFTGSLEEYKSLEALFKKLGRCKMFSLCNSCILVYSIWQLRNQTGLLFGWKCLEFEVELTKWHLPGISCLLRTSPHLETLAMYIYPEDDKTFRLDNCEWAKQYDFDGGSFWRLQEGTFHCLEKQLKTIKIYGGYITEPYVIDTVEFLLKNATVLEKLEISTNKTLKHSHQAYYSRRKVELTTEQRLEFSQKLLSLPRASPRAVIRSLMQEMGEIVGTSSKTPRVLEEEVVDRISSLPDSVIIHILSFLPTQDAVRTVAVPIFRHLWNFLPILTFDHSQYSDKYEVNGGGFHVNEYFLAFIRHVLMFHQNKTIDKFFLKMDLNLGYFRGAKPQHLFFAISDLNREKSMSSEVDSWVHFAMRKEVKDLDLAFVTPRYYVEPKARYRLPSVVFRGKHLVKMKLVGCEIIASDRIELNCLKQLVMGTVVVNNENINKILCGCSVLEELSLDFCYGLNKLSFRNPSIKRLKVFQGNPEGEGRRLEISCPNIESLDISGCMNLVDLANVSSVVDFSIAFMWGLEESREHQTIKEHFNKLSGGKIFRACARCILVFTSWQLLNQPNELFGWKSLEFKLCPSKWYQPGIYGLLRSSPCLETLAMYICTECEPRYPLADDECQWMKSYDFDGEKFWRSQEGTFHCLEKNLKSIKIYGHISEPYVIDMIEFLLKNAMVLEKLEISSQKTFRPFPKTNCCPQKVELTTEQRQEFSQKDYEISKHDLINLWMAQGFIQPPNRGQSLEDVGHDYFMALLWRSFFQEPKEDGSGNIESCKMHDLMHDLGKSVAGIECSLTNLEGEHVDENTRHVSLGETFYLSSWEIPVRVSCATETFSSRRSNRHSGRLSELSMLNNLRGQLEIFLLSDTYHPEIGASYLKEKLYLESLFLVGLNEMVFESLQPHPNLKNLKGWWKEDKESIEATPTTTQELLLPYFPHLSTLIIRDCPKLTSSFPLFPTLNNDLQWWNTGTRPLQQTLRMRIKGEITSASNTLLPLSNLKCLSLYGIENVVLEELLQDGRFTCLESLHINSYPELTLFPNEVNGLTSLHELSLYNCPNLMDLPSWIPSLTSLRELAIGYCPKIATLPPGMSRLTNLHHLKITECPHLTERCQSDTDANWSQISHVPDIVYY
ncbi:hypothetical protein CCACVL1_21465 [Corchorus capsularis]|uniref:F-box domain-containing protein n=1 Tax=Corchorus capsularis TaxID=210143 RepID=A0A1R3H5V3_COCAP|nr:hypothetical protein CCACVL1_21465 [Corchorus capsularis]